MEYVHELVNHYQEGESHYEWEYSYDQFGSLSHVTRVNVDDRTDCLEWNYVIDTKGALTVCNDYDYFQYGDYVIARKKGTSIRCGYYDPGCLKDMDWHTRRAVSEAIFAQYLGITGEFTDMQFIDQSQLVSFICVDEYGNEYRVELNYLPENS